ncbi:MAG: polysaccharide biosynthesis C-terminal domain-containing protein, partial [Pirellulales bacterium]|nr:polysaccharide biosynthesis C-terminal domain-containing protein [Pirellulales bacterium]
QNRVRLNIIRSCLLITRLLAILAVFHFGTPSIIWVAATQLLLSISEAIALYVSSKVVFPWQRLSISHISGATFRRVNNFSLLTLVAAVAGRLYWDADSLIINKLLEPTLLAGYAIVVTLLLKSYELTRLVSTALGSPLTVLYSRGEISKIYAALCRCNRFAVPIGAVPILFLMLYGEGFLTNYVGADFSQFASLFPLLGSGLLLSQTQVLNAQIPQIMGKTGIPAIASMIAAICNLVISVVLVSRFEMGLSGVAWGTVSMLVLYRVGFWMAYSSALLDVSQRRMYLDLVVIPLAFCVPALIVLVGFKTLLPGDRWSELLVVGAVAFAAQLAITLRFGLEPQDFERLSRAASASYQTLLRKTNHS